MSTKNSEKLQSVAGIKIVTPVHWFQLLGLQTSSFVFNRQNNQYSQTLRGYRNKKKLTMSSASWTLQPLITLNSCHLLF